MNILDLGKPAGDNRVLLEAACRGLVAEDPHRPITYTAVKHRMSALRAEGDQRPTTSSSGSGGGGITPAPRPGGDGAPAVTPAARTWPGPKRSALTRSPRARHQQAICPLTTWVMTPRQEPGDE
jgi:hypothetical protein